MSGFEIYVHPEADAGKALAFGITGDVDGSGDSPSVAYNHGALREARAQRSANDDCNLPAEERSALNGTYYLFYERQ